MRNERPGTHPLLSRLLGATLLCVVAASCTTLITPGTIAASQAPGADRARVIALLEEAVTKANDFLESEERRSLPAGKYEMDADGEFEFVTADERWPFCMVNSFGGDLVVTFGFRAQERDDGFVVGSRPPDSYPEIDNSMFRMSDGAWHSADSVAQLILHETAHMVHGEGTVGYWNTLAYYAEAIFLWRTYDHSAERIPNAVDEEFTYYRMIAEARAGEDAKVPGYYREAFEEHLAEGGKHCTHLKLNE